MALKEFHDVILTEKSGKLNFIHCVECTSFLLPLTEIASNLVALNNMNLLSYIYRSHKSKINLSGLIKSRCWEGSVPSGGSEGGPVSLPYSL